MQVRNFDVDASSCWECGDCRDKRSFGSAFLVVGTGPGPEGSRLTADNSRLQGCGAEEEFWRLHTECATSRMRAYLFF